MNIPMRLNNSYKMTAHLPKSAIIKCVCSHAKRPGTLRCGTNSGGKANRNTPASFGVGDTLIPKIQMSYG